jgi:hypothetical protein
MTLVALSASVKVRRTQLSATRTPLSTFLVGTLIASIDTFSLATSLSLGGIVK